MRSRNNLPHQPTTDGSKPMYRRRATLSSDIFMDKKWKNTGSSSTEMNCHWSFKSRNHWATNAISKQLAPPTNHRWVQTNVSTSSYSVFGYFHGQEVEEHRFFIDRDELPLEFQEPQPLGDKCDLETTCPTNQPPMGPNQCIDVELLCLRIFSWTRSGRTPVLHRQR